MFSVLCFQDATLFRFLSSLNSSFFVLCRLSLFLTSKYQRAHSSVSTLLSPSLHPTLQPGRSWPVCSLEPFCHTSVHTSNSTVHLATPLCEHPSLTAPSHHSPAPRPPAGALHPPAPLPTTEGQPGSSLCSPSLRRSPGPLELHLERSHPCQCGPWDANTVQPKLETARFCNVSSAFQHPGTFPGNSKECKVL